MRAPLFLNSRGRSCSFSFRVSDAFSRLVNIATY